MISSKPKSKSDLIRSLTGLPTSIKFEVLEVFSNEDQKVLKKMIQQHSKKGYCSVIVLEGI